MAQIETLKERGTGKTLYPITSTEAVFDRKGRNLETRLDGLSTDIEGMVERVPGKGLSSEDFTPEYKRRLDALPANVQGAFTVSDDFVFQKGRLELSDVTKIRWLIDWWEAACKVWNDNGVVVCGRFNYETGFFELNGIKDITAEQALRILLNPPKWVNDGSFSAFRCQYTFSPVRTHLPLDFKSNYGVTLEACFHGSEVEVIDLPGARLKGHMSCRKLHTLRVSQILDGLSTSLMPELVDFEYHDSLHARPRTEKSFEGSPKLSLASVKNLVDGEPQGDTPVVFRFHADVYAKLTGDTTNGAAAALTPEELAQWTQLLADAAEKNITFTKP